MKIYEKYIKTGQIRPLSYVASYLARSIAINSATSRRTSSSS